MSIKTTHELKSLRTRLATAITEHEASVKEATEARQKENTAKQRVNNLRNQITEFEAKTREPIVTEHALLRYIERVYKIDLEEIRDEILSEDALALIDKFGSGKFPAEGCRLIVKDRVVITVEV